MTPLPSANATASLPRLSARMAAVRGSDIMDLLKRAGDGDFINFASGLPDPALFPADSLKRAGAAILTEEPDRALQYGPAEGFGPLRDWIAERLRHRDFQRATPETVLITHGAQQAIDLCARMFIDPGDLACVETPTYSGALLCLGSFGARYPVVGQDDHGLDVDGVDRALQEGAKLVYALPNFQNPTGRSLSGLRRQRLAEYVADAGGALVEDDAYHDLRYDGDDLPPVSALMQDGVPLYVGSFSKIVSPGLRVGYIHGPEPVIQKLTQLKQLSDVSTGAFSQRLVHRFVTSGDLDDHIAHVRASYRSKRNAMLAALEHTMPDGVAWTHPEGGMFLWLTLPPELDAAALLTRSLEMGVMFVPGAGFHPLGGGENTMRLNFASPPFVKIAEGIAILSEVIQSGAP